MTPPATNSSSGASGRPYMHLQNILPPSRTVLVLQMLGLFLTSRWTSELVTVVNI